MKERRETERTVGCMCGFRARGADDASLRGQIRTHVDRAHPEFPYTEEQIRLWVASGARDAIPTGPFGSAATKGGGANRETRRR
jgi:predicted small metal-binding protein